MSQLKYTSHDRPYLEGPVDFNISHMGTTAVACAMVRDAKVGMDVESYCEVDFSDFTGIHSQKQQDWTNSPSDPQKAFFDFWTVKESVIKADGKGLSIPLDEIMIDLNQANHDDHCWYLKLYSYNDISLAI